MVCVNPKTKVLVVLGARREAIKAAPIIDRLRRRKSDFETIVLTITLARENFDPVLSLFNALPNIALNLMHIRQGLPSLTSHVLENMSLVLETERPDLLLTEGNSPAALACSLAAHNHNIPIALLTSYAGCHPQAPSPPEDINRRLAAVLAEMHFASTRPAKHCLIREGISEKKIIVTGNPLIDALKHLSTLAFTPASERLQKTLSHKRRLVLFAMHAPDPTGQNRQAAFEAARTLAHQFADIEVIILLSAGVGSGEKGRSIGPAAERIQLITTPDVITLVHLLKNSYAIVTHAEEIPEEASAFQKPVLMLENGSARTPGVLTRSVKTIHSDAASIAREAGFLLNNAKAYQNMLDGENPYGDGQASERIVTAINHWSKNRQRLLTPEEEFSPSPPLTDLLCRNL